MKKSTMIGLVKGNKIQHKKSGLVLTVITVTDEGVQCEEKFISTSNCTRWFDLVEQPVQPKEAVEDKPVEPIKPTITVEKTVEDKQPEEHTEDTNSRVVAGKNSIDELFNQFNKVLDEHNAYFKQYKQYIGVLSPRKKGTLLQLRKNREGSINIDIKKCIWEKLKVAYKIELQRKYNAYVYDKTRGYIRFNNMDDVNTFTVLLLTALS